MNFIEILFSIVNPIQKLVALGTCWILLGLSENVGYIPNEITIFHRDNDQQNHWV